METNNKLREAVTKILDLTNSLDEECAVDPVEIRDIAKAALAEPAKNCEVGTVEEQAKRLNEWCNGRHCINCRFKGGWPDECKLKWAQMPYEEGVPNAE